MTTPTERSKSYREAAAMARSNARVAKRMAREYPDHQVDIYVLEAARANERAEHYDRLAETMMEIARTKDANAA